MTRFIHDEKTGTTYYYFDKNGEEIGFIPMTIPNDGVEIIDTDEGGIVEIWDNPEDEKRIRALLDNKYKYMNLKEIYNDKKKVLDYGYMQWYNDIEQEIENDEEYTLSSDELNELVVDLMLSNVLGEITTFDEVTNLLKLARENEDKDTSDTIITK